MTQMDFLVQENGYLWILWLSVIGYLLFVVCVGFGGWMSAATDWCLFSEAGQCFEPVHIRNKFPSDTRPSNLQPVSVRPECERRSYQLTAQSAIRNKTVDTRSIATRRLIGDRITKWWLGTGHPPELPRIIEPNRYSKYRYEKPDRTADIRHRKHSPRASPPSAPAPAATHDARHTNNN